MVCLHDTGRRTALCASRVSEIYFFLDTKNNLVASGVRDRN
jgi:hypothetical protein